MTLTNIYGEGVIIGAPVHKGTDKRTKYARTPVFDPSEIPAGRQAHIGGGVFRRKCADPECGVYADTWGGVWWVPKLAHHEHQDHGLDVVGVNVAVLP